MHSIWFTLSGAFLAYPLIYAVPANMQNQYSPAQSISVETWSEVEAASAEDNPSDYQHFTELYDNGHKAWLQEQKRKEDAQKTQWTLGWLTKTKTNPKLSEEQSTEQDEKSCYEPNTQFVEDESMKRPGLSQRKLEKLEKEKKQQEKEKQRRRKERRSKR